MPGFIVANFVKKYHAWITDRLSKIQSNPKEIIYLPAPLKKSFVLHREDARKLIEQKVSLVAGQYGVEYGRISIRNQQSRWGSCSRKGNLNFNFKIYFLPPELQDYIVVHEVCHLLEFNHSPRFWDLVGKSSPDHKALRKRLKNIRFV